MYQISLVAAYIAGIVALFAPCCISYLFPAYLGNVFKERRQVIGMTVIYSLGIFTIMTPVVLGARALSMLFFNLHDYTYIFGGILMLIVGFISFLGIKLPMPQFSYSQSGPKNDIISTYTLGIFSGITSACCAPVLIGVITLSALSPTTLQSLGIGFSYVLGMVTPLYVASAIIHKKNILKTPVLKKKLFMWKFLGTQYPIFVSNIIAFAIFTITGSLMLILTYFGKLGMTVAEGKSTKAINTVAFKITEFTSGNILLDLLFIAAVIFALKKFVNLKSNMNNSSSAKYTCPMHPEIIKDKKGKCPECGMSLVRKNKKQK
jgi:cytochrome c biogenesis protein CcdA